MSKEDLILSIKRHATSKIISAEDLEKIKTFGFRGEALASIAAVAELEIRTKLQSDQIGYKLLSEPNKDSRVEPFMAENGTQIFVRNLFYNVPARKKFLKSDITEFRHIAETVIKFSIANYETRFTFYDNEELIFDTKQFNLKGRITEVLGNINENQLMFLNYEEDGIAVKGVLGKPNIAKSIKSNQYLYLNKRTISSKAINHAVYSCFEHILDKTNHPFFAIFIELDYTKVDVNVHPQKQEVKFEDERKIYSIVKKAINQTLLENNLTFDINIKKDLAYSPYEINKSVDTTNIDDYNSIKQNGDLINTYTGEVISNKGYSNIKSMERGFGSNYNNNTYQSLGQNPFTNERKNKLNTDINFSENKSAFDALFGGGVGLDFNQTNNTHNNQNNQDHLDYKQDKLGLSLNDELFLNNNFERDFELTDNINVFLLHKKYIFLEVNDGSLIIDMHNAHERILYERVIERMNNNLTQSQNLLFPEKLNMNFEEIQLFMELKEELEVLGYNFVNENNEIYLTSQPIDVAIGEQNITINELITQYLEFNEIRQTNKRDNIAASYACKSAIKTGYNASNIELKQLIIDLFNCKTPYVCPHGRPVILNLTLKEIDYKFKRS